jgi:hypothetical protein
MARLHEGYPEQHCEKNCSVAEVAVYRKIDRDVQCYKIVNLTTSVLKLPAVQLRYRIVAARCRHSQPVRTLPPKLGLR